MSALRTSFATVLILAICVLPGTHTDAQQPGAAIRDPAPIRLSIHYLDGLSSQSRDEPQEIRFLHRGCHLSLLLTNRSKREIHLWKPSCPEGDDAIRLEFRVKRESEKVGIARTSHSYTGGMGIPRTLKLVPGDSLVYRIDFSSFWSLPFVLEPHKGCELLVRAVYESTPTEERDPDFLPDNAASVWTGRVQTDWQRVKIWNVTDRTVPEFHRGINLLE
jgi:hypothetical protein